MGLEEWRGLSNARLTVVLGPLGHLETLGKLLGDRLWRNLQECGERIRV